MPYEIIYDKAIRNQLRDLPGHIKAIAKQQIANLSDNPRPPGSKELTGHPNYYRLWLGTNYRLVWHIFDDEQVIEIEYVGPKPPDLYDRLGLARPSTETDE
ncbi:MAG: type II toxin-antitoxin system mRNA interferase toxin, RelE/StbE family [Chloroflexi bacterium]|nr:type II toxin-antitoxin system mRNA interferase toxin, RelE/StbE family [Chloroflexota bacterium]